MKKLLTLVIAILFFISTASAFAGPAVKAKPLSKSPDVGLFQNASDHISQWGKSAAIVKQQSLRVNKDELKKRTTGRVKQ